MDPFDLATLLAHRRTIEGLDPSGRPVIAPIGDVSDAASVAILPGSFDPPTAAHLMFAERAVGEGYDRVLFLLARRTAGKASSGLLLEDRILALSAIAEPPLAIGVCSHGLYAEQAEAAAGLFPGADLVFLVGSDKVLQIFDPAWYDDRDEALDRLFARARLVVAPRADHSQALAACLEDPANRPWSERVVVTRLHPAVCDLSSTHVRGMLRSGADPGGLVPPDVAGFLARVHAFSPAKLVGGAMIDAYEMRARLLANVARLNGGLGRALDLRALVDLALSDEPDGARLRDALHDGSDDDLVRAMRAAEAR